MAKEQQPEGYQFRHAQRLTLDAYNGIASDIMAMHDPTADGFMRVADMRKDIVVTQKAPSKTVDYDQVGPVRIAKFLTLPGVGMEGSAPLRTRKEDDSWVLEIDDKKIWNDLATDSSGNSRKPTDEQFVDRFAQEIRKGLRTCLAEEKFLNSGDHTHAALIYNYVAGLGIAYVMPSIYEAALIAANSSQAAEKAIAGLVFSATVNLFLNGIEWEGSRYEDRRALQKGMPIHNFLGFFSHDDPFIRHSFPEFFLPTVPVDRFIRGAVYLKQHGNELITSSR